MGEVAEEIGHLVCRNSSRTGWGGSSDDDRDGVRLDERGVARRWLLLLRLLRETGWHNADGVWGWYVGGFGRRGRLGRRRLELRYGLAPDSLFGGLWRRGPRLRIPRSWVYCRRVPHLVPPRRRCVCSVVIPAGLSSRMRVRFLPCTPASGIHRLVRSILPRPCVAIRIGRITALSESLLDSRRSGVRVPLRIKV